MTDQSISQLTQATPDPSDVIPFVDVSDTTMGAGGTTKKALVSSISGGTVTSVAALTLGTTGTDLSSTVANGTTTPVITLQVPTASATNRGALSSTDWTTFNNKQATITNPVTGTGTTNQLAYWTSSSAQGALAVATYPSLTEVSYVKGVTSAIQTQINAKGAGTVTAVSVATANGVSGSSSGGATPALTITLGAITPSTVNGHTFTTGSSTFTGTAGQTYTFPSTTSTLLSSGGALGTPASGTVTNLTGTASININGTVGATTATTGKFTSVETTGNIELGHASDTTLSRVSAGLAAVEGKTIVTVSDTQTLTNKTLTSPTLTTPALGTPASGTLTSCTGLPAASVVAGALGTGAYTMDTKLTVPQVVLTANAITATANAATVPVTSGRNIVTNNSASGLTITMTTTNAVSMQTCVVQILPSSAAAQTLTFVNTENSAATSVPANTGASTTIPISVGFIYNAGTSKWTCVASS